MIRLAAILTLLAGPAMAASEDDWNRHICHQLVGEAEVDTPSGARVDCLDAKTAWEADWTGKWAEAIGQAMLYAHEMRRRPGIILLCRKSEALCLTHKLRMLSAIGANFDLDDWDFIFVDAHGEPGR